MKENLKKKGERKMSEILVYFLAGLSIVSGFIAFIARI